MNVQKPKLIAAPVLSASLKPTIGLVKLVSNTSCILLFEEVGAKEKSKFLFLSRELSLLFSSI